MDEKQCYGGIDYSRAIWGPLLDPQLLL